MERYEKYDAERDARGDKEVGEVRVQTARVFRANEGKAEKEGPESKTFSGDSSNEQLS